MGPSRRLLFLCSVGMIVAATLLPPAGARAAPATICWRLACSPRWLADGIANLLLFVPFGIAVQGRDWSVRGAAISGLALSLGVEILQSLGVPPGRSPALADVLCNGFGALCGGWLIRSRDTLLFPHRTLARRLAYTWVGFVSVVLLCTALALGFSRGDPVARASATVVPSPFDYSPGYGWYGGRVDRVAIGTDGTQHLFLRSETGPLVLAVDGGVRSVEADAWVSQLDASSHVRSLVYLHPAEDSLPRLMIAQHGQDALLVSARRANTWGLHMPYLRLADGFAPATRRIGPTQVHAVVRNSRLALGVTSRDSSILGMPRELALTPLLGWALLQSVVHVQGGFATVVELAWITLLVLPLGFWGFIAGGTTCTRTLAFLGAVLAVIPVLTGMHAILLRDVAMVVLAAGGGILLSRLRPQRLPAHPLGCA